MISDSPTSDLSLSSSDSSDLLIKNNQNLQEDHSRPPDRIRGIEKVRNCGSVSHGPTGVFGFVFSLIFSVWIDILAFNNSKLLQNTFFNFLSFFF